MEKKEMIQIVRMAIEKNMDFETLKYSDYMYGNENLTDKVYEYVIECKEQGTTWFYKKYAEYLK